MVSEVPINDSTALVMTGRVDVVDYGHGVLGFADLMAELDKQFGNSRADKWIVDALEVVPSDNEGWVRTGVRGEWETPEDKEAVEKVVAAYEDVGRASANGQPLMRFSSGVQRSVRDIRHIINGHIRGVRFETTRTEFDVYGLDDTAALVLAKQAPVRALQPAFGAIRGRVDAMSRRGGLRFTLYDYNDDRPISCYMDKGNEELMRDIWGKIVVVEGTVRRDPLTGLPTAIRQVTNIGTLDVAPTWDFARARGAVQSKPGDPLPEQTIRRMRNG